VNDPALTYTSTGLVSATVDGVSLNDTISGSLSRTSFGTLAGEQVGTFAISQNTLQFLIQRIIQQLTRVPILLLIRLR